MRHLVLLTVASTVFFGACDQATGPAEPSGQTPQAASNSHPQHATGSVFINLADFGAPEHFSFSAIRHANGRVSGQWQLFTEQDGGIRLHGIVTCLGVFDNLARIGGLITKSTEPDFVGGTVFWSVIDNGEGANSPPDEATDLAAFAPPEIVEAFCAGEIEDAPFVPSEQGNIQVHD